MVNFANYAFYFWFTYKFFFFFKKFHNHLTMTNLYRTIYCVDKIYFLLSIEYFQTQKLKIKYLTTYLRDSNLISLRSIHLPYK
jgi:hypothetical protein